MSIKITIENDDGEEETMSLPAKMEVCPECQGSGFVLCEGMRGHAYSAEEFAESFDEEEAQEYFTRGGMYDTQCDHCHGQNVVPVVEEDRLTPAQKEFYQTYLDQESSKARMDAEDRATMRAECGYRDY